MSKILQDLRHSAGDVDRCYVRVNDSMIYGPITMQTLCDWCEQGRVTSDNEVSFDRLDWVRADAIPELALDWIALSADGSEFGPFHIKAVGTLARRGVIDEEATLRNRVSGEESSVAAAVQAAGGVDRIDAAGERLGDTAPAGMTSLISGAYDHSTEPGADREALRQQAADVAALRDEMAGQVNRFEALQERSDARERELTIHINTLEKQVAMASREVSRVRAAMAAVQAEADERNVEQSGTIAELREAVNVEREARGQAESAGEDRARELAALREAAEAEQARLAADVEAAKADALARVQALQSELSEAGAAAEAAEQAHVQDRERLAADAEARARALRTSLEDADAAAKSRQQELRDKLDQAGVDLAAAVQAREALATSSQVRIAELEAQTETLQARIAELEAAARTSTERVGALTSEAASARAHAGELEAAATAAAAQVAELESGRQQAAARAAELEAQVEAYDARVAELEAATATSAARVAELETQVEAATAKATGLEQALADANRAHEQARAEAAQAAAARTEEAESRAETLSRELADMQAAAGENKEALAAAEAATAEVQEARDEAVAALAAARAEVESHRTAHVDLKSTVDETVPSLQGRVAELEQALADANRAHEQARAEAAQAAAARTEEAESRAETLSRELADMQAAAGENKEALAAAEAATAEVQEARDEAVAALTAREGELTQTIDDLKTRLAEREAQQAEAEAALAAAAEAAAAAVAAPAETPAETPPEALAQETPPEAWFMRLDDGTEVGPVAIEMLVSWADQCRLGPDHEVSPDGKTWRKAAEEPMLGMEWEVELVNGVTYGPIRRDAARELVSDGAVAESAVLKNLKTGELMVVEEMLG